MLPIITKCDAVLTSLKVNGTIIWYAHEKVVAFSRRPLMSISKDINKKHTNRFLEIAAATDCKVNWVAAENMDAEYGKIIN